MIRPGAFAKMPEGCGEQDGSRAVERRERAPHQAHAAFQDAEHEQGVDSLDGQAQHRGDQEDDRVVVRGRRAAVQEGLAQGGFVLADDAALIAGDDGAQVLLAEEADGAPGGPFVDARPQHAGCHEVSERPAESVAVVEALHDPNEAAARQEGGHYENNDVEHKCLSGGEGDRTGWEPKKV